MKKFIAVSQNKSGNIDKNFGFISDIDVNKDFDFDNIPEKDTLKFYSETSNETSDWLYNCGKSAIKNGFSRMFWWNDYHKIWFCVDISKSIGLSFNKI